MKKGISIATDAFQKEVINGNFEATKSTGLTFKTFLSLNVVNFSLYHIIYDIIYIRKSDSEFQAFEAAIIVKPYEQNMFHPENEKWRTTAIEKWQMLSRSDQSVHKKAIKSEFFFVKVSLI